MAQIINPFTFNLLYTISQWCPPTSSIFQVLYLSRFAFKQEILAWKYIIFK